MSDYFDSIRIAPTKAQSPAARRMREKREAPYVTTRRGNEGNTPAQDEVLRLITEGLAEGRIVRCKEIAAHMGWKRWTSAVNCLLRLAADGRLPSGYPRSASAWKG